MDRFFGWIVTVLNIVAAFYILGYFASNYQLSFAELFILNAGLLSIVILSVGFFIKNHLLLSISVPFLATYGFLGLSTSSWSQGIPSDQFSNLLMVIAIIYVIYATIYKKAYVEFIIGIAIGMFLVIPFNMSQIDYIQQNPALLKKFNTEETEKVQPVKPSSLEAVTVQSITSTQETITTTKESL